MDRTLEIFISSAIGEFANERAALKTTLECWQFVHAWAFELEAAHSHPVAEDFSRRVAECDVYVLLIGKSLSPAVESEYRTARDYKRSVLAFVKDLPKEEREVSAANLIEEFETKLPFKYKPFESIEDLTLKVMDAVGKEIAERVHLTTAQTYQLVRGMPRLPRLSQTERDELDRAYLAEVVHKYEFWRTQYIPLAAITRWSDLRDLGEPTEFVPRGFALLQEKFQRESERAEHYNDLRDAIEKYGDLILLGDPGAGKTTTLWRLMFDYAQRAQSSNRPITQLPILISLGRYDGTSPILDFLRAELVLQSKADLSDSGESPHHKLAAHLDEYLDDERLMLLFDALNEMPQAHYSDSICRLEQFREAQRGNRFIFTCRALDYTTKLDLPKVTIQDLDEDAQRDFLTARFSEAGARLFETLRDSHRDLLDIGRNPYLLRMMGEIYQRKGELSPNRGLLFQDFVNVLLQREHETYSNRWFDSDVVIGVLSDLAFAIQREHGRGTSVPREWADKYLTGTAHVNGRDVAYNPTDLLYLARSASLLDESADGSLRFTHQLLQEYFAAVYLDSEIFNSQLTIALGEQPFDGRWNEVILMLAGITRRIFELVRWIADEAVKKQGKNITLLAVRCWKESCEKVSKRVPSSLIDALLLAYASNSSANKYSREFAWLVYFGADENNLKLLINSLKQLVEPENFRKCAWTRYRLIDVIEEIGDPAVEAVIPLLQERDKPSIRSFARGAFLEWRSIVSAVFELGIHTLDEQSLPALALDILSRIGTPRATKAIVDVLRHHHPDKRLRREAVRALSSREPYTIELLIDSLRDPDMVVRERAKSHLGWIGDARALPELDRLGRPSVGWLKFWEFFTWRNARRAAREIRWRQSTLEQRIAGLKIWDSDARMIVIRGLVEELVSQGDSRAIELLVDVFHSTNDSSIFRIHDTIIEGLGKIGGSESADALLALPADHRFSIWEDIQDALAKTGDPRALDFFVADLHDEFYSISDRAANRLAQMGSVAVSSLVVALHDPDKAIQWRASDALTKIGVPAVESLIVALRDPDIGVRKRTASVLGNIGDPRALPELERLVSEFNGTNYWDSDAAEAEKAIDNIRWHQKTIEELIIDLTHPSEGVRGEATWRLGWRIFHPRSEEALIKALYDPNRNVRERVIWALGKVGDFKSLLALDRIGRESEDEEMAHDARVTAMKIRERLKKAKCNRELDGYWKDIRPSSSIIQRRYDSCHMRHRTHRR